MGGGYENGDMGGTRTSEGSIDSNPNPEERWESGKRHAPMRIHNIVRQGVQAIRSRLRVGPGSGSQAWVWVRLGLELHVLFPMFPSDPIGCIHHHNGTIGHSNGFNLPGNGPKLSRVSILTIVGFNQSC
jgi:hypothetical protein